MASTKIDVGRMVLVEDVSTARENWPLGRIVRQINEDEIHGRRFAIRLANGRVVDRHVSSIVLLEL